MAPSEPVAEDHEAHGYCRTCLSPVHCYCGTWQHVNLAMTRHDLIVVTTCCGSHGQEVPIDFTAVTAALDAAHYPADDPVRRQIGAFDFPNIPDAGEAGYRGKGGY